jgi:ATP-dependent helicase/nuclease subunit B
LLARRVAIRLEAWGIRVDDSAGRPFRKTVPGAFLDLVIEAAAKRFAPAEVMALLKHPLTRLGLDAFAVRRAGRALEIAAFRGPYLGDGLAGIDAALERAARHSKPQSEERTHMAVRRLFDADWDGARDLVKRLTTAFAPLEQLFRSNRHMTLADIARAHVAAAEALAALPAAEATDNKAADGTTQPSPIWTGEAGSLAQRFFGELFAPELEQPVISAYDYPDLYRSLLASENVRPRIPVHPRLFIWGPFEARLQQTDVMVLGSLNDGTWPESTDPGPWLNRSMRRSMGLPLPEEKIGHAAHDFTSFLGAGQVVLTRALKADGVPTVPSRWLMRLSALLDGLGIKGDLGVGGTWLDWARARDRVAPQPRLKSPKPKPTLEQRPRRLSVSRIETWIANPYAIFAKDILCLEPLAPLGQEPDAALRGSVIHASLAKFAHQYPAALPADIKGELLKIAMAQFAELKAHPRVAAFWLPRFERFAEWFAETEPSRRIGIDRVVAETSGKLILEAPAGPFTLTARADRIDVGAAGLTITDYKTGQPPSANRVAAGFAPQLPLEAAMAAQGVFAHVPAAAVAGLRYTNVAGGEPPGRDVMVATAGVDALAKLAVDGLRKLIGTFDDPATPYEPKRRAIFKYDYDDYAHLARVAEWSADPGAGGEEA